MGQHIIKCRILSDGKITTNSQYFYSTMDGEITDKSRGYWLGH